MAVGSQQFGQVFGVLTRGNIDDAPRRSGEHMIQYRLQFARLVGHAFDDTVGINAQVFAGEIIQADGWGSFLCQCSIIFLSNMLQ